MNAASGVWCQLAGVADQGRAAVLRVTMSVPGLRGLYCTRVTRLGALFVFSCATALALSLAFPLWVLALGPAIYGVPHLFASLRYFHHTAGKGLSSSGQRHQRSQRLAYAGLALIMGFVALYRFMVSLNFMKLPVAPLSEWRGSTYLEIVALAATFAFGAWVYQKPWRKVLGGALMLLPLGAAFARDPGATIGGLVLLHNFIAFAYWWHSAKSAAERRLACGGGLVVFGITALIFLGSFDPFFVRLSPAALLPFASLTFEDIGTMVTPWSEDPGIWRHAAVAYAFGQAMHYFVWLKAVPDQHHRSEMPTSFRQSYTLLESDFGRGWASWIIAVTILSTSIWFLLRFSEARAVYFCLAAFHGYLEIAGLALASSLPAANAEMRAIAP